MPPSDDNMPDFESMTPEELQAWMETLAERQGATEGFTTEARFDVAEIDPDTVDVQDNYIPYGKTAEEWAEIQARERAERDARRAAASHQPTEPAVPIAEPEPEPAPAQPAAQSAQPDFESMTPEELQAWMESLAERQGATEGFTTETRYDVDEIDPDTVDVQDNYIPYGKTADEWAEIQARERAEREARRAASSQPPPPPAVPEPEPEPELQPENLDWLTGLAAPVDSEPIDEQATIPTDEGEILPEMDLSGLGDDLDFGMGGLDLDIDLDAPLDLDLDLEGLDLGGLAESDSNPLDWLDGLVADQPNAFDLPTDDIATPEPEAEPALELPTFDDEPEGGTDTLEWLEQIARRPGEDGDAPTSFSLDDLPEPAPLPFDGESSAMVGDPSAWLDELAGSSDVSETGPLTDDGSDDDITGQVMADLERGVSDPDAVKNWMDAMLEAGASLPDVLDRGEDEDEDAPLEQNIPDWLQEAAPVEEAPAAAQIVDDLNLDVTLDTNDMPDWLAEGFGDVEAEADIDFIEFDEFDDDDEIDDELEPAEIPDWLNEDISEEIDDVQAIFTRPDDMDPDDSWVEAFELEREMRLQGLEEVPDEWLEGELPEVDTSAVLEETLRPTDAAITLADVQFDDDDLPIGEPESVPSWMDTADLPPIDAEAFTALSAVDEAPEEPIETEAMPVMALADDEGDDLPDWLRMEEDAAAEGEAVPDWLAQSGLEAVEDVPDWLLETVTSDEAPDFDAPLFVTPPTSQIPPDMPKLQPAPQSAPQPAPQPVAQSPAPVPVTDIDADAALQTARAKLQAGDVAESLQDYEAVVRVNQKLDAVVDDLTKAVKDGPYKHNAAVHRVLGDGLMRQGKLQDALNTYRRALNLL